MIRLVLQMGYNLVLLSYPFFSDINLSPSTSQLPWLCVNLLGAKIQGPELDLGLVTIGFASKSVNIQVC